MQTGKVEDYYNAVAAQYHEIYEPSNRSYANGIGDYFRLQIVLRILAQVHAQSVFEVGTGDGTPLESMYRMGISVAGCDIAPNMVEETRRRLTTAGIASPQVWRADICNSVELAQAMMGDPADAVIALGVMPHVDKDMLALKNMRTIVRDGGKLLIEFRNSLFSLFTFNRLTHDFIVDELLLPVSHEIRSRVSEELKVRLRMDLPPVRDKVGAGTAPGYDAIPAKFHNPFTIPDLLKGAGFANPVFHWYHFHAAMPMLQPVLGRSFDEEAIALEHNFSNDWRGFFLCSAVLVEADAV